MQPESTPVFISRLSPGGIFPHIQKKKTSGGVAGKGGGFAEGPCVNVIGRMVMLSVHIAIVGEGVTVIIASTGWVLSEMPPITSDRATMVTRNNLKKTAVLRHFPKFHVLIYLPPYLLQQEGFIFPLVC
jgi:hypothetical protein